MKPIRTDQTSDAVLWEEVKKNNANAFELLFKRYWSDVCTAAFRHVKDRGTCADLGQDIFLRLWEKRSNLEIESFKPYLQAAARYHVYRFMRTRKISPMLYAGDLSIFTQAASTFQPSEVLTSELQKDIDQFVEKLPRRCQEVFSLSRKDHLSNDEIATRLDISKRTVENQLTYALRQIRLSLKGAALMIVPMMIMI